MRELWGQGQSTTPRAVCAASSSWLSAVGPGGGMGTVEWKGGPQEQLCGPSIGILK